jgi:integrase
VEQKKFLAPPLKAHLELMKRTATTPYLFPKAYEMVKKKDRSAVLSNQFAVFLVKAGILDKTHTSHKKKAQGRSAKRNRSGVGFHSLRHGATSLLKQIGVGHAVAQEIVGHDSKQVSQHYTHIGDDAIRDALKNFPDLLSVKPKKKAKK